MGSNVLSAFQFYGGKARMAPLICDMLDYDNTDIYIEPFGGGARVLLNKPRHPVEIYNDASAGLCSFMRAMSDQEKAREVIGRLYDTEFTIEEFNRALMVRNQAEDNFIDELKRQASVYLRHLFDKYGKADLQGLRKCISRNDRDGGYALYEKIINLNVFRPDELDILNRYKRLFDEYIEIFDRLQNGVMQEEYEGIICRRLAEFKEAVEIKCREEIEKNKDPEIVKQLEEQAIQTKEISFESLDKKIREKMERAAKKEVHDIAYSKTVNNHDDVEIDDVEMAVAVYIIYSMSRDGMGTAFSPGKYKSTDEYHAQMRRLYDVAERMEGVQVQQVGALAFLLDCNYLNDKRAMFYLDPSYLDPEDGEKNLGEAYKLSSDREAQELLLKTICHAKAKILISNYDVDLYNRYLADWHKMEFETSTSVGGKAGNKRTEILWWNY